MKIEQINRIKAAIRNCRVELRVLEENRPSLLVSTPFMMPDGDLLGFSVVPVAESDRWMLADFGETVHCTLFIRGHLGKLPESYESEIQRVIEAYGAWHPVEFNNGTLSLKVDDDRLDDALRHFTQMVVHTAHVCSFGAESELDREF